MARVFVYDEFSPEDTAMMQALYSRSSDSVENHADKVKEIGSGKFMERFYVGYGHKSIADCGSTTIFIEGVSMLVAKAIQDWPLYSGQETSSRYIDYAKQALIDPANNNISKELQNMWMDFYITNTEKTKEYLREKYPRSENQNESVYERALAAWSFDVMRGYLPAGITTQLSWHTNLRQAWDKLSLLLHHPLEEVREVADNILKQLKIKYAHSFGFELRDAQEAYMENMVKKYSYFDYNKPFTEEDFIFSTTIENNELECFEDAIEKRPKYTPLPLFLGELGTVQYTFMMDFGSFRDIQRHRNGVCRMPLLTTKHGFNSWYLRELPADVKRDADSLIEKQEILLQQLHCSPEEAQYYIPMGYNIITRTTYALPAAVYVAELRAGKTVHPTLRVVAHKMHDALTTAFPKLALHCDLASDSRDVKRGNQTIEKKS